MLGNEIIVNPGINGPRGRLESGTVDGTPKPGTCMQLKTATAAVNGQFTWVVYNVASDGQPAPVVVALRDDMRGRLASDAYVTANQIFLYWPVVGDELNMLVDASLGDIAIGDKFQIDDGTGKLVAGFAQADVAAGGVGDAAGIASTINDQRRVLTFQALEAVTNPSVDTHVHCRCIANC